MRIERISPDKVRFFLTPDDLAERQLDREDLWKDLPKVHELFHDMLEQAYYEVGFEARGPVAVEIFTLPAHGMVVVISRTAEDEALYEEDGEESLQMEVLLAEREDVVVAFRDIEHVIAAAQKLAGILPHGGRLYAFRKLYVLYFPETLVREAGKAAQALAVLTEYGEAVSVSEAILEEYGKKLIAEDALGTLRTYFARS
ncbi:adaptor protein MecA [Brockia lithotrophica]|uniref:Adapter protein MecA 1/2 n=1 Tax=Brockia lithotrophica TaxID=933949 RepID=A0A660L907_9BACL|nr:adaptor protein MecA [Brockia lithotrophica]RKQ88403.1 adapter protein MecA 1/2 [Brockia lithotrophica]